MRPGTVGMKTGRAFQRSDKMDMMHAIHNSTQMMGGGFRDEFVLTPAEEHQHIKISLMGRNKLNTASAEQAGLYTGKARPLLNSRGNSAIAKSSP